jgi:hypothetical protein
MIPISASTNLIGRCNRSVDTGSIQGVQPHGKARVTAELSGDLQVPVSASVRDDAVQRSSNEGDPGSSFPAVSSFSLRRAAATRAAPGGRARDALRLYFDVVRAGRSAMMMISRELTQKLVILSGYTNTTCFVRAPSTYANASPGLAYIVTCGPT